MNKNDTNGIWNHRILLHLNNFFCHVYSALNYFQVYYKGIQIGSGCKFYDSIFQRTKFIREMKSSIKIGSDCQFRSATESNQAGINRPCQISTLYPDAIITIGDSSGFSGVVIAAAEKIEIGDRVMCGVNVTISDTDWHGIEPEKRNEAGETSPIIIEDDVWIGMNSIILKGVTIGSGSVIGAGSVVTKSIPPSVIAAGNPAKIIKQIESTE